MGYHDEDDQNLDVNSDVNSDVNHVNRNCVLRDPKMDGNLDVSRGLRKNVMDDRNLDASRVNRNCVRHDQKMDGNLDASRVNRNCVRHDQKMDGNLDVTKDVNRDLRMNGMDDRNDLMMVVNLLNRNWALRDLKTGGRTDVSRGNRMNDLLDDLNLDAMMDGNHDHHTNDLPGGHRMNVTDDRNDLNLDVNRAIRNCVLRDLKMDGNLDAMSRRVMLMVYLNMSRDRMSHDHLRCGHLKMRHRDTNRMDGTNLDEMNLDGKMMNHHVNRRMKGDHLMVCPMKI